MKVLSLLLLAAPIALCAPRASAFARASLQNASATPESAPKKPEELLFASVHVLGADMTSGVGLEKEIGVPVTFADVVDASVLFPHAPITWHAFTAPSLAGQQVEEVRRGGATLVVAPDYLVPFVYTEAIDDEARVRGVETALKLLESFKCTVVLGDVPDLRATLKAPKPLFAEKHLPGADALTRINAAVTKWAEGRKNVVIAPVASVYARIEAGEAIRARSTNVPVSWLPELIQENRVHTRAFGSIATWLVAFESLHRVRADVDGARFDGSMVSIFNRLYASKEAERRALLEKAIAAKRLPPNRPPPARPLPPDPEAMRREEEAKRRGIDVRELEREARDKKKDKREEEGRDGG